MDIKFNTSEEYMDWIMSRKELWIISKRHGRVIHIMDIIRSKEQPTCVHITYRVNGTVVIDYYIGVDPRSPRIFDNESDAREAALVSKLCGHL